MNKEYVAGTIPNVLVKPSIWTKSGWKVCNNFTEWYMKFWLDIITMKVKFITVYKWGAARITGAHGDRKSAGTQRAR